MLNQFLKEEESTTPTYSYLRIETQTTTGVTSLRNSGEIELYDSSDNLLSDNNTTHHDTSGINYTHTSVSGLSSPLNNMIRKYDNSSASSPFNIYTAYSPHAAPHGNISHLIDTYTSLSGGDYQKPAFWYSGGGDGIIFEFLNNQSVDKIIFKTIDDSFNNQYHSKVTKVYGWNGSSWIDLTPSNISSWDTANHATNTITGLDGGTPELNAPPNTTLLGNTTEYINNGAGNAKISPYSHTDFNTVSGLTGALSGMTAYIEPPRAINSGTKIYCNIPISALTTGYRNLWNLIDGSTNAEQSALWREVGDGGASKTEIVVEFPSAIDINSFTHTNRASSTQPNNDVDIDKIEYWDGSASAYQTITTTPTLPFTNPHGSTQGVKYDFVFSSVINAQYFKITYAYGTGNKAIGELELQPAYKYLGFYTTSISTQDPALYEMIINYTGGSITYNSTEELGATNTAVDNSIQRGYGMAYHSSYDPPEVHKLFDSNVVDTIIYMTANGVDKFYFYLELDTPIPDITAFKYWTYGNNSYSFNDLSIYGTNTDPATMGTNGSNMNTLAGNWTLLSSPSTTTKAYYNTSYPAGGVL